MQNDAGTRGEKWHKSDTGCSPPVPPEKETAAPLAGGTAAKTAQERGQIGTYRNTGDNAIWRGAEARHRAASRAIFFALVAGDLASVVPVLCARLTRDELLDLMHAARAALSGHDGLPTDPAWRAMFAQV